MDKVISVSVLLAEDRAHRNRHCIHLRVLFGENRDALHVLSARPGTRPQTNLSSCWPLGHRLGRHASCRFRQETCLLGQASACRLIVLRGREDIRSTAAAARSLGQATIPTAQCGRKFHCHSSWKPAAQCGRKFHCRSSWKPGFAPQTCQTRRRTQRRQREGGR